MKKQLWLIREGMARDLLKIYTKFEEFVDSWDKRHERLAIKVAKLERQSREFEKKLAKKR